MLDVDCASLARVVLGPSAACSRGPAVLCYRCESLLLRLATKTAIQRALRDAHICRSLGIQLRILFGCACRKLNPGISVMESAQDWATKNVPGAIDGARDRCILFQR